MAEKLKLTVKPYHVAVRIAEAIGGKAGREYLAGYRRRRQIEEAACGVKPALPKLLRSAEQPV